MQLCNIKSIIENNFKIYGISSEKLVNEFINSLTELNINYEQLEYFAKGESSIVFSYMNSIIKLSFVQYNNSNMKKYVSYSTHIAPVLYEKTIDFGETYNAHIYINKKYNIDYITNQDVINLYWILRNDGYLWYDTKISNVGKDENGKLMLLDYGELINLNLLKEDKIEKELQIHQDRKIEHDLFYKSNIPDFNKIKDLYSNIKNKLIKRK